MQKRKLVGLDFDDVVFDFNNGLLKFHNENYGTSYKREDVTSFDFKELWQCDFEESLRRMHEFVTSSYHDITTPVKGAVEAVTFLESKYHVPIITARDKVLIRQTRKVARKYFPGSFKEMHFLHQNGVNVLGTKGDVCVKLGVTLMVEDSLGNAEDLSKAGVTTLLFDTPWNQAEVLPKNVFRVHGWEHALYKIEEYLG